MPSLASLAAAIREDRERYIATIMRALQAQDAGMPGVAEIHDALDEIADALARQDAAGLERWARRRAEAVGSEAVATLAHAVAFAVAAGVEDDPELFDVALVRLEYLERRAAEVAALHARIVPVPAVEAPPEKARRRRLGT